MRAYFSKFLFLLLWVFYALLLFSRSICCFCLLVVFCVFVLLLLCFRAFPLLCLSASLFCSSAFPPFLLPSARVGFSFSACCCFCFCFSAFPLFGVSALCSSAFMLRSYAPPFFWLVSFTFFFHPHPSGLVLLRLSPVRPSGFILLQNTK